MKLGVSRQTVLQRLKRGELQAWLVTRGRRKGLRIKVEDDQPGLFQGGIMDKDPKIPECRHPAPSSLSSVLPRVHPALGAGLPWSPVGEPQKVLFVNLIQDCHHRVLEDSSSGAAMPRAVVVRPLWGCRLS